MGFTGLRIEPHAVLTNETICVAYLDGRRVAVIYFHPALREVKVMHEGPVTLTVDRRTASTTFERTMYTGET